MDKINKILLISTDKALKEVLGFCFDGWGYEVFTRDTVTNDITPIKKMSPDVIVVDVHSASKANLEICRILKDDFITAFTPVIALINKRQLRSHLLTLKQGVDDYLIKPPDPLDLRIRIEMAIRRAQYSFYSSPLTGLPGGRIIEETLRERLRKEAPFSFGYLDLDNFKYFNDVCGYVKGDRAIMQTAYMLYTTIRKFGNPHDFIGHIGGDDFVFITTPDKYKDICHNLIVTFNDIMPFHYATQDRERGFIVARDRTHKVKNIPLLSVSIAVVTKSDRTEFRNVIEINERVAEIKRYLKTFNGSKYMTDRRNLKKGDQAEPQVYPPVDYKTSTYKPLGQMLLERDAIEPEQLDEALSVHWRRGIMLGEVLDELGFVPKADLEEFLRGVRVAQHH